MGEKGHSYTSLWSPKKPKNTCCGINICFKFLPSIEVFSENAHLTIQPNWPWSNYCLMLSPTKVNKISSKLTKNGQNCTLKNYHYFRLLFERRAERKVHGRCGHLTFKLARWVRTSDYYKCKYELKSSCFRYNHQEWLVNTAQYWQEINTSRSFMEMQMWPLLRKVPNQNPRKTIWPLKTLEPNWASNLIDKTLQGKLQQSQTWSA